MSTCRTGKRSTEGALQDGVNSITRYVRNNFFDGSRQDAYDLFTGAWTPRKGVKGDKRALAMRALPYLWLLSVILLFTALFIPALTDRLAPSTYIIAFAVVISSATFYAITERGVNFVAWPSLNRPDDVINYSGPGYSSGRKGRKGVSRYGKNSSGPQATGERKSNFEVKGRRGQDYDD